MRRYDWLTCVHNSVGILSFVSLFLSRDLEI